MSAALEFPVTVDMIAKFGEPRDVAPAVVVPAVEVAATPLAPNMDDINDFSETLRACGAESLVISVLNDTKPKMTARRFRCDDPALLKHVVQCNAAGQNVFYCSGEAAATWRAPNPPTIEQIVGNRFAHSDVDYHVSEPADEGYARVLKLIRKLVDDGKLPTPSLTVFSGGGFQFYWFGNAPISPEEIVLRNRHINRLTGGDHTHNCNRLLRIPGTVNWLNAAKRKRGRVPTLSKIVREVIA